MSFVAQHFMISVEMVHKEMNVSHMCIILQYDYSKSILLPLLKICYVCGTVDLVFHWQKYSATCVLTLK